jgi:outer membrane protein assembly factor BamB
LNAATGEKIWTYKTGADVESFTSVANGVVYIGSNYNYIYAIGAITNQQPTSPSPTGSPSPTVPEFSLLTIPLLLSLMVAAAGLLVYLKRKTKES